MRAAPPGSGRPAFPRAAAALLAIAAHLAGCQPTTGTASRPVPLSPPKGFALGVFAVVPGAGPLARTPDGAVLAGTADGRVIELRDENGDGVADRAEPLLAGLEPPLAVAVTPDGRPVVATRDRVIRLEPSGVVVPILPTGVLPELGPDRALHLAFGPGDRLFLAIPAACRACRSNAFSGSVLRMRSDGHEMMLFARGISLPGGIAWHRPSGTLLVTDRTVSGRAPGMLKMVRRGDPEPPFRASIVTPMAGGSAETRTSVALNFPAGSRPAAVIVRDGGPGPAPPGPVALVALAGSGPPGYELPPRIIGVPLDARGRTGEPVLVVDGWGTPGRPPNGRPAGLLELDDGSILISDDLAGRVYRLAPSSAAP